MGQDKVNYDCLCPHQDICAECLTKNVTFRLSNKSKCLICSSQISKIIKNDREVVYIKDIDFKFVDIRKDSFYADQRRSVTRQSTISKSD